jgi:hypothetical protein
MHAPVRSSAKKLFLMLTAAMSMAISAPALHAQYDANDPPPQAGRISIIQGSETDVQPAGTDTWGQAYPNLPIGPGDRLYVHTGGRAEIQIGQTFLRLGQDTDITLTEASPTRLVFAVGQGSVHVRLISLWPGQALYLQAPNGSIGTTHPSEFRLDVIPGDDASIYTAFDGYSTAYTYPNTTIPLPQNQPLEIFGSNPVASQWLGLPPPDALDGWSRQRDAQILRAASFQYVSPEVPGAWELDAAGQWTPNSPYGNIWFPNVQPGWAPYRYGHWVSRNPWGWIWVEDESWGYAPFHYGRWVQWGNRWGWVPGPPASHPVWSPALVVFAGGIQVGGSGVSAWFPLGPGEAFRPWYPCSPRYIDQVNITNLSPAPRVVVQKTYVNIVNVNVTNITYVNRTVGVTAVPQEAMTSGRSVAQAHVQVDAQTMARAQVLARPQVAPPAKPVAGPPPTHTLPARVAAARPTVMNEKGQVVAATPHAKPAPPPARPAPQVKPPAGRTAVAPPPGSKAPNAAKPGTAPKPAAAQDNTRPAAKPATPGAAPAGTRPQQPAAETKPAAKPAAPAEKPAPAATTKPAPADQAARPGQPNAKKPNPKDKNKPRPEEKKPEDQKPEEKPQ